MKRILAITSHLVFWSWNLVFIGIVDIWLLPEFGLDLLFDTRNGLVEPTLTVSLLILLIVPLLCTVLGFWRLRSRPTLLMRLFYGVEAPLFTLCLLRLFLLRELTSASAFAIGLVLFSIVMFAIELLVGYAAHNEKLSWVQMVGHSLILVVGGYAGSLLLLYTVPSLCWAVLAVLAGLYHFLAHFSFAVVMGVLWDGMGLLVSHPLGTIFGLLFSFLGFSSVLVFVSMPYAFVSFYIRAWERIHRAFGRQYGAQNSWAITGVSFAVCFMLFVGLQLQQPQVKAFDLLDSADPALSVAFSELNSGVSEANTVDLSSETVDAETVTSQTSRSERLASDVSGSETSSSQVSVADVSIADVSIADVSVADVSASVIQQRQRQLQQSAAIRSGLTHAYLHRYRYLSPWNQSTALSELYQPLPKVARNFLQTIHNGLVSPFLYRGEDSDVQLAERLYAQFFDQPIQQGERAAIRKALQTTANRDETKAGLLDLDQKVVRLAKQTVTVDEHGDWATVELHERYENNTPRDQEIFYSFSLPESAAITGLWLGPKENPKLFPQVVSPRGAAQQVYNDEVERANFQRATDPALLEQVGPRQYRLRVFPIPQSTAGRSRSTRIPGELDLTMTYAVMADPELGWPLPQLSEKRNIYWTADTEYVRGERRLERQAMPDEDTWLESAIARQHKTKPTSHTVTFREGYRVSATPFTKKDAKTDALQLAGENIAVIVDSSYSMGLHQAEFTAAIAHLKAAQRKNSIDFYMAVAGQDLASKLSDSFAVSDLVFYGTLQPADMLFQFAHAVNKRAINEGSANAANYDAIILLTDQGSYELADDKAALPELDVPLWIAHIDGALPKAYEDNLLQLINRRQGGIGTKITSILERIALSKSEVVVLDGYRWDVSEDESLVEATSLNVNDATAISTDRFTALAARQLIRQQGRKIDAAPSQIDALDAVHAIAKRTSIVTPYSSMLVLVDERQREALRAAEAGADRFEREIEDGHNDLTQPGNVLAASVPEPGQVVAIVLMAIALMSLKRNSVRTKPPQI